MQLYAFRGHCKAGVVDISHSFQVYNDIGGLTLAIMGTGTQAEYHLKAMFALEECSTIRFKRVMLFGRNPAKLEKLHEYSKTITGRSLEIDCFQMGSEAIQEADIICTCTSSEHPILR